jgi:hypothetical protein
MTSPFSVRRSKDASIALDEVRLGQYATAFSRSTTTTAGNSSSSSFTVSELVLLDTVGGGSLITSLAEWSGISLEPQQVLLGQHADDGLPLNTRSWETPRWLMILAAVPTVSSAWTPYSVSVMYFEQWSFPPP